MKSFTQREATVAERRAVADVIKINTARQESDHREMEEQKRRRVALLDQSMGHECGVSGRVHGDPSLSSLMTHIGNSFYIYLSHSYSLHPFSFSWHESPFPSLSD